MIYVKENTDKRGIEIKIKYFTDIEPIKPAHTGEWVDLRAADTFELKNYFSNEKDSPTKNPSRQPQSTSIGVCPFTSLIDL